MRDQDVGDLFAARSVTVCCHILCLHRALYRAIVETNVAKIHHVFDAWCSEYTEMSKASYISHMQIFDNKESMMVFGCPHPHVQI